MQAIMVSKHGGPEVLEVSEIPMPEPGPGEVLVRVLAAGVGPWDVSLRELAGSAATCRMCRARSSPGLSSVIRATMRHLRMVSRFTAIRASPAATRSM